MTSQESQKNSANSANSANHASDITKAKPGSSSKTDESVRKGIIVAHYGEEFGVLPWREPPEFLGDVQPVRGILPGRFLMLPPMEWERLMEAGEVMPAVGDLVNYREIDTMVLIESVGKRRSLLSRKQAGQSYGMQIIAANVDLMFVVMPVDRPLSHGGLLRYITLAGSVPVHLIITKCDLDPVRAGELKNEMSSFLAASSIHLISAQTNAGAPASEESASVGDAKSTGNQQNIHKPSDLKSSIHMQPVESEGGPPIPLVCFVGPSGAGKSTLVNSMLGRSMQETSAISESTGKGRHTTVRRDWIWHEDGFGILDTPGMRELGLDRMESGGVFAPIEEFAEQCHFRDCSHESEQGCAVLEAVTNGQISAELLDQYRQLSKEVQIVEDFRKTRKKSVADESKEALRQSKEQWMKEIQRDYRRRPKKRG